MSCVKFMKRDSNTKQYEHMMHCGYGVLVWCKAHSLAPASRCGDVSDPVVLHAARSWIPPGVHTGGGFVKHNQVGGRSKRYWKMHTHTHITITTMSVYLSVIGSRSTFSMEFLKISFKGTVLDILASSC